MGAIISAAFQRMRTTLLLLVLLLLGGLMSYVVIPKEASPEIEIPYFIVNITYSGISAEDSARLLIEPVERRLNSIDGLRKLTGQAGEGFASIMLEFEPGVDQATAFQDVRDEVDNATPDLPAGADAPIVREIDVSVFPILTVALSGPVPERDLIQIGRDLSDRIESVSGVLQASVSGEREDLLEIIVNPLAIQSYGISGREVAEAVQANNQVVAAGAIDTGAGRVTVGIPGTIQTIADVLAMPVRVSDGIVVRVQDVADVRQSYRDPVTFARLDGQNTIGIDITKVSGANILETVAAVRREVEKARQDWPETITVSYMQDQSEDIATMLGDLENSVILAILMVMLPTILALGLRASLLIGIAIPGAFFSGILIIYLLGFTLNIVVLFALILVIGMLVDGAMVVVEKADRMLASGVPATDAYREAAIRMAWPVIAGVATTLAVFFPLLFWPGLAGRFMFYLPATVLITLSMSLFMALIFVPVAGRLIASGRAPRPDDGGDQPAVPAFYRRILSITLPRPGFTLGLALLALILSMMAYGQFGRGAEFFPAVEPERAQIQVKGDGNLSVWEADRLVRLVEAQVIGTEGVELVYTRTIGSVEQRLSSNVDPDVIGTIQLDLTDWRNRPPASEIIDDLRRKTAHLPGIGIQIEQQDQGLGSSRPVEIELSSSDNASLVVAAQRLIEMMVAQGSFTEISSDVPPPGVEVRLEIDRELAARYGVDIATLGNTVQLMTNGVTLGSYLPPHLDEEVDIVMRFPAHERHVAQLGLMRVQTQRGMIPLSNFVRVVPGNAPTVINYADGEYVQTVTAGIAPGLTVAEELNRLGENIAAEDFGAVDVRFAGEIEDQVETMQFLVVAFLLAIFLMFLVMLTQLDSFFQSFLVLSAIICSVPGVLLILMLTGSTFSVVMGGMGIMALAGVVVNNNIILIDAYNEHRKAGLGPDDAATRAAGERLRPILLTTMTTVTGLLPMAMGLTIDFFGRDVYFGAPSGQFWVQLSMTIIGGLLVGTIITSCLTPTLLAWDGRRRLRRGGPTAQKPDPAVPAQPLGT